MRLHLVDGTFELFRAHFSPRPGRTAPDGRDVKATVGVIENMIQLLGEKDEAVTHLAMAFDNPIRSFRNDLFAGYKSDEGVPPELRSQFDLVEEGTRLLGIRVWSMNEHEADDGIATAVARFGPQVEQVRILSPDKDFGQCVQGTHVVLVDRIRRKVTDEAGVREKWGIGPEFIPDLLALTGDDADGIPGLPGFGAKTAAALLAAFGHLEQIPDDATKWPNGVRGRDRLAPVLAAARKEVLLYRHLATLDKNAKIDTDLEALRAPKTPDPKLEKFLTDLGAKSVWERARW